MFSTWILDDDNLMSLVPLALGLSSIPSSDFFGFVWREGNRRRKDFQIKGGRKKKKIGEEMQLKELRNKNKNKNYI
jgi:hypothetical protein